jgi:RNA polymerase sigma-70 factor (ECF subfamily)
MRPYKASRYSDEILLDLVKSYDDRAAFSEIYFRYWQVLLDTAYQRLKSREASEQIVQEVFIDLFIRRDGVELKSNLEAWLKTALKYKVYNIYRAQQVHLRHLDGIMRETHIAPVPPDEVLDLKEIRERIKRAAARLPEKCREVFLLSRLEHLPQQEIAARLNISVSTVKKHITKAIRILKSEFQENYFDLFALILFFSIRK